MAQSLGGGGGLEGQRSVDLDWHALSAGEN